jgi:hypothetical protein
MNHGPGSSRPDLTTAQVELLIDTFETEATKTGELLDMLRTYADAGGRDWETYERFLDHLARSGMRMVMAGRTAINPDLPEQAGLLLGAKSPGLQGEVHHSMSASTLCAIWAVGEHHLIDVENWSDQLPRIVRAAVEQAPRINEDPNLSLRNKH